MTRLSRLPIDDVLDELLDGPHGGQQHAVEEARDAGHGRERYLDAPRGTVRRPGGFPGGRSGQAGGPRAQRVGVLLREAPRG